MRLLNCLIITALFTLGTNSWADTGAPLGPYDQQTTSSTTTTFMSATGDKWTRTCTKMQLITYSDVATSPVTVAPPSISISGPNEQTVSTAITAFLDAKGTRWTRTCVDTEQIVFTQVSPDASGAPVPPIVPLHTATISGYTPATAPPGTLLSIAGSGFGALVAPASGRVNVNGVEAIVKSWTDTLITCVVPQTPVGPATIKLFFQAGLSASPALLTTGTGFTVGS